MLVDSHLEEVEQLMRALVRRHAPGLVGEAVSYQLSTGGKRLRARLALGAFRALERRALDAGRSRTVGADVALWAAACEILHNGTLVHDDVQDGDRLRRSRETVWVKFGVPQAINVGDMMLMLPILAVAQMATEGNVKAALSEEISSQAAKTVCGQSEELDLVNWLGSEELPQRYRQCIKLKTSALFELPVFGAAMLCGRELRRAKVISEGFQRLGIVFQIQDDILDLYGEKGRDQMGTDLKEGKVSALVVAHLNLFPSEAKALRELLLTERSQVSAQDVEGWTRIFAERGALKRCCWEIEEISRELASQNFATEDSELKRLLLEMLELVRGPIAKILNENLEGFQGGRYAL